MATTRRFYHRMFRASIRITVKIWFARRCGGNARHLFVSPLSTFCDSWRNEFNCNRAVSNRNEFAEKSWCAKYTASDGRPGAKWTPSVAFASYRSTGRATSARRSKLGLRARARPALVCRCEETKSPGAGMGEHTPVRFAWRPHASHFAIRANPHRGPPQNRVQVGAGHASDQARAASAQTRPQTAYFTRAASRTPRAHAAG